MPTSVTCAINLIYFYVPYVEEGRKSLAKRNVKVPSFASITPAAATRGLGSLFSEYGRAKVSAPGQALSCLLMDEVTLFQSREGESFGTRKSNKWPSAE